MDMILKLIQSLLKGSIEPSEAGAPQKKESLVDIAAEAIKSDPKDLERLISLGMPEIERRKFKERVKKKVSLAISKEFDEPDIIEEVTERITNAAEFDQYYRDMFEKE